MNRKQPENAFFLQVILVSAFVFTAFMLFALARSIYRDSFQVGAYIDRSMDQIAAEQAFVESEQAELRYAKTPQYQEKIAKELLGLQLPGEEVIIISNENQDVDDLLPESLRRKRAEEELLTTPQKWLRFLFGV